MATLEWAILANYAEAPPMGGLIYVMGGAWDTITMSAPLEGAPPGVVAVMQGHLVIRMRFEITETNREHGLALAIIDEDGGEVGRLEARFRVDRVPGLPPAWGQGTNLVIPLTGIALQRFGLFDIHLSVDDHPVGVRPFRILKGY